jgi:hypothetical protein
VDHIRTRSLLPRNSALATGHGATNTAAASLITFLRILALLNAPRAGIGHPLLTAVKSPSNTPLRLPTHPVRPLARKTNSGKRYIILILGPASNDREWCRYSEKSCCLPVGGPHSQPKPPAGKQCPVSNWSWSSEHSCCVPHQPNVDSHAPHCDKAWKWSKDNFCCEKSSQPSSPSQPSSSSQPSSQAQPTPGPSSCKKSEFWWAFRSDTDNILLNPALIQVH